LIVAALVSGALAGFCLPAHSQPTHCEISSIPAGPTASAEAFSRADAEFSATMHIQCFDAAKSPISANPVCVSARREHVSGSSEMVRAARAISYEVTANGVLVADHEQKIWGGAVTASGADITVGYRINTDAFVGFPQGAYHATTKWKVHLHMETCP
jgi:hypothetical protein